MKIGEILSIAAEVGLNIAVKAMDESENRQRAKRFGYSEDGLMVQIMNYTSEMKRKKQGFKI